MTPEEEDELRKLRAAAAAEIERAPESVKSVKSPDVVSQILGYRAADAPKRREQKPRGDDEGSVTDTAVDVGKTLPWIAPKAAAGLVGMPHDTRELARMGREKLQEFLPEWLGPDSGMQKFSDALASAQPAGIMAAITPGSGQIRSVVEKATGVPWYDPKTRTGKVVDTAGQVAITGGRAGWRDTPKTMAAITGATTAGTELAGELTDDNPWARLGGGLALGGVPAAANAVTQKVGGTIRNAIGAISPEQERLAKILQQLGIKEGFPLTGTESLGKGNQLDRYALTSLGGAQVMNDFYGKRPKQTEDLAFRRLLAPTQNFDSPQDNAARGFRAAEDRVGQLHANIAGITKPWYDAGRTQLAGPDTLEGITEAIKSRRPGVVYPENGKYLDRQSDAFDAAPAMTGEKLDRAHKTLREEADALKNPTANSADKANAFDAEVVRDAVDYARKQLPGIKQGNDLHSYYMQNVMEPIMDGPLGRLATARKEGKPVTPGNIKTSRQNVLDTKLMTPAEIRGLHQQLNAVDPAAWPGMVKTSFEVAMNKATNADIGGGARKLWKALYGNDAAQKNTEEALRGVAEAHGLTGAAANQYVDGARNMMRLFERTRSPGSGSETAMRGEVRDSQTGSMPSGIVKPLTGIGAKLDRWANVAGDRKLATVLTSPDSVEQLIKLAKIRPNSLTARYIVAAMLGLEEEQPQ